MRKKITGILLSVLLIAVLLLVACESYSVPSPLSSAVPEEADLLIGIQISEILNDEDFGRIYERMAADNPDMPATISGLLDHIQQETQVDPRDFHEAVIFADTSELTNFMYSPNNQEFLYGVLFKGSFAKTRALLTVGGDIVDRLQDYDYMGVRVYRYVEGRDVLFSFAFINNEVAVAGSTSAVEDVIDVIRGEKQSIGGKIYEFYEGLGENLVKMAYLVPGTQMEQIPPTTDIDGYEVDLSSLRAIDIIGLTFYKAGSSVTTRLQALHSSQAAARDTEELINVLLYLTEEEPLEPEVRELLDKIDVSVSDSVLILEISETVTDLEDYLESLSD